MSIIKIKENDKFVVATNISLKEAKRIKNELLNTLETFYVIRIVIA
jgi:hypothetical protein